MDTSTKKELADDLQRRILRLKEQIVAKQYDLMLDSKLFLFNKIGRIREDLRYRQYHYWD